VANKERIPVAGKGTVLMGSGDYFLMSIRGEAEQAGGGEANFWSSQLLASIRIAVTESPLGDPQCSLENVEQTLLTVAK
jgi:hypothetical protein